MRKATIRCRHSVCAIGILRHLRARLLTRAVSNAGSRRLLAPVAGFLGAQQIDIGHAATAFFESRPSVRQVGAKNIARIGSCRHFYPVT
jgi:hypothetical protein